jgi:hypothetical protein
MSVDAEFVPLETALIILQARETAREILGCRYGEFISLYKRVIVIIQNNRGSSLVDAVVWLADDLKENGENIIWAFSAFADLCDERGIALGTAS